MIRVNLDSGLKQLDPIWTTAYIVRSHSFLVYDTLFGLDKDFMVQPQMVDRYSISDDGLLYSFTLRDGLKWHDGTAVTSKDCVASIKRWGAKDGLGKQLMAAAEKLEIVDNKTFKLKLKYPFGMTLLALAKITSNVPFMMKLAYIIRRLLAAIPVAGVVAVFVFLLLHLAPGDPAAVIAGSSAMPEDVERIRAKLGLDEPIYNQFGKWISNVLQGDLGDSIFSEMPVTKLIAQRIEPTLSLATTNILIAIFIAVPMGVIAAWKAGTWIDYSVMIFAVFGFSIPVFVIGYLLMYGFSIQIQIFPVQGFVSITEGIIP